MAFRFRKRIKLFPGVWVNLSKTGASVSAGVPGATVNMGHGKTRATVGLPGTGLSYSTTSETPMDTVPVPLADTTPKVPDYVTPPTVRPMIWFALVLAIGATLYTLAL